MTTTKKVRKSPASPALRELGRRCFSTGMSVYKVCRFVGYSYSTVTCWVKPGAHKKQLARQEAWKVDKKDYLNEQARLYRKNNPELIKQRHDEWRLQNLDYDLKRKKVWRDNNKERMRVYYQDNKHLAVLTQQKRRFWKHGVDDYVFIDDQWFEVDKEATWDIWKTMFYSQETSDEFKAIAKEAQRLTKETGVEHQLDHLVPLAKGGTHIPENLEIRTAAANQSKGSKLIERDVELFCKRLFNL